MPHSRAEKLALLQFCLDLNLPPEDLGILRNFAHHYAMGREADWGAANQHLKDRVKAIFYRCKELIGVS